MQKRSICSYVQFISNLVFIKLRLEKIRSVAALLWGRDNISVANLNNFGKTISFSIFIEPTSIQNCSTSSN